jgi:cytidylate kinase
MKTTITISRQMGSGGSYIGQRLAQRLQFKYVDREVLRLAAEEFGCTEEDVAARAGRISSFWSRIFGGLSLGGPDALYSPPPLQDFSDKELFNKQREILKRIAAHNDCVLIGWPAVGVLPRHPRLFSLFCHAPISFRVKRAIQLGYAKNENGARQVLQESDAMRKKYFLTMTGHEWSCAENFHLTLDTSLLPLDDTAELIIELLRRKHLIHP